MGKESKSTLKSYFNAGDKPTESQFGDLIDSFINQIDDSSQQISGDLTITGSLIIQDTNALVGIGTATPGEKLEVKDGSIKINRASSTENNSPGLIQQSNDDFGYVGGSGTTVYLNHYGFGFHNPKQASISTGAGAYMSGYFGIDLFTGGQNRLTIEQFGNIGIGTTNPEAILHVKHSAVNTPLLRLESPTAKVDIYEDADTTGYIRFRTRDSNSTKGFVFSGDDDTAVMVVSSSGQISIGQGTVDKSITRIQTDLSGSIHGNAPVGLLVNGTVVIDNDIDGSSAKSGGKLFIGYKRGNSGASYTTDSGATAFKNDRTFSTASLSINPGSMPGSTSIKPGQGSYNYKVQYLGNTALPFQRKVILLHEAYTSDSSIQDNSKGTDGGYKNTGGSGNNTDYTLGLNLCSGTLTTHRGGHHANNKMMKTDIHSSAGFEGNQAVHTEYANASFNLNAYSDHFEPTSSGEVSGGDIQNLTAAGNHGRLVTCLYNSRLYVAYELPYADSELRDSIVFTGVHSSTAPNALEVIAYANVDDDPSPTSADFILNAEIYNSITNYGHNTLTNTNISNQIVGNTFLSSEKHIIKSDLIVADHTGSAVLQVEQNSKYVGINTDNPSSPLEIRGDIHPPTTGKSNLHSGIDQIRIMSHTNGSGAGIGFSDQITGDGTFDNSSTQHGHLRFYHTDLDNNTDTGALFRFTSNQNLGVQISGSGNAVLNVVGNIGCTGALSKGSGTFTIDHPDPSKTDTHYLQHSFVESPTGGDNIYRWTITTVNKTHTLTLPDYYKFLNKDDMVWVNPTNHFGKAYGIINEDQTELTITSDTEGEYNILLIGTRKDPTVIKNFKGVEVEKQGVSLLKNVVM